MNRDDYMLSVIDNSVSDPDVRGDVRDWIALQTTLASVTQTENELLAAENAALRRRMIGIGAGAILVGMAIGAGAFAWIT